LSGLTAALALVPEAIAFALVAHVSALTGVFAAFIMRLMTAALCGPFFRANTAIIIKN
jgi:SulP family sulfate permease